MNNTKDYFGQSFSNNEKSDLLRNIADDSKDAKLDNIISLNPIKLPMNGNDGTAHKSSDVFIFSTGEFSNYKYYSDQKKFRSKYSLNNLARLKKTARKPLKRRRHSRQWTKKLLRLRKRLREKLKDGFRYFALENRKYANKSKKGVLKNSLFTYPRTQIKYPDQVNAKEKHAIYEWIPNKKEAKPRLPTYYTLNMKTTTTKKSSSNHTITTYVDKTKLNFENYLLEIKLRNQLLKQTYIKAIQKLLKLASSGDRSLGHCSCILKLKDQDFPRHQSVSVIGGLKHEQLRSLKCKTNISLLHARKRNNAGMDENRKTEKVKTSKTRSKSISRPKPKYVIPTKAKRVQSASFRKPRLKPYAIKNVKTRLVKTGQCKLNRKAVKYNSVTNLWRLNKISHTPKMSRYRTANKTKIEKKSAGCGKLNNTENAYQSSSSVIIFRPVMSGSRKTRRIKSRLSKCFCKLDFKEASEKRRDGKLIGGNKRISGYDWNIQRYKTLKKSKKNKTLPRASKKCYFKKTKHFYKYESILKPMSQSTLSGSTSCIEVLSLSSNFCYKLNLNLNKNYPVSNICTNKNHSRNYKNSFSRTYYTMNVHKTRPKLDPNECEHGVCIPYECDPYECKKLILKRLRKTVSKKSVTSDYQKTAATGTTRDKKTKRARETMTFDERNVKGVQGKKSTKNARPQTSKIDKKSHGTARREPGKRTKDSQSRVSITEIKSGIKRLKRCFCTLHFQTMAPHRDTAHQKRDVSYQALNKSHRREIDPHECEPYICIPGACDPRECLQHIMKRNEGFRTRKLKVKSSKATTLSGSDLQSLQRRMSRKKPKTISVQRSVYPDRQAIKISSNLSFSVQFGYEQIQSAAKQVKRIKDTQSTVSSSGRKHRQTAGTGTVVKSQSRGSSFGEGARKTKNAGVAGGYKSHESRGTGGGRALRNVGEGAINLQTRDTQAQIQMTKDQVVGTLKRCFCTLKLHKIGDVLSEQMVVVQHRGVKQKHGRKPDLQSKGVASGTYTPLTSRNAGVAADRHRPPTSRTKAAGAGRYEPPTSRTRAAAADGYMSPTSQSRAVSANKRWLPTSRSTTAYQKRRPDFRTKGMHTAELLPYECEPGVCMPDECDPYECDKRIRRRRQEYEDAKYGGRSDVQIRKRQIDSKSQNQKKPIQSKVQNKGDIQGPCVEVGSKVCISIEFFSKRNPPYPVKRREEQNKLAGRIKSNTNPLKRCFCTKSLNKGVPVYQLTNYTGFLRSHNQTYCPYLATIYSDLQYSEVTFSNCWSQQKNPTYTTSSSASSSASLSAHSCLCFCKTEHKSSHDHVWKYFHKYITCKQIESMNKCFEGMEMHSYSTWNRRLRNNDKNVIVLFSSKKTKSNESKLHSSKAYKEERSKHHSFATAHRNTDVSFTTKIALSYERKPWIGEEKENISLKPYEWQPYGPLHYLRCKCSESLEISDERDSSAKEIDKINACYWLDHNSENQNFKQNPKNPSLNISAKPFKERNLWFNYEEFKHAAKRNHANAYEQHTFSSLQSNTNKKDICFRKNNVSDEIETLYIFKPKKNVKDNKYKHFACKKSNVKQARDDGPGVEIQKTVRECISVEIKWLIPNDSHKTARHFEHESQRNSKCNPFSSDLGTRKKSLDLAQLQETANIQENKTVYTVSTTAIKENNWNIDNFESLIIPQIRNMFGSDNSKVGKELSFIESSLDAVRLHAKKSTFRLIPQRKILSSRPSIQVLRLSSDFSYKLNFNVYKNKLTKNPKTNFRPRKNQSRTDYSSYSRTYYTMNVQKLPAKLDPNECEPGICIPNECDPYKCHKIILKRLEKALLKNAEKKKTASDATRDGKTKKSQERSGSRDKKKTTASDATRDGKTKKSQEKSGSGDKNKTNALDTKQGGIPKNKNEISASGDKRKITAPGNMQDGELKKNRDIAGGDDKKKTTTPPVRDDKSKKDRSTMTSKSRKAKSAQIVKSNGKKGNKKKKVKSRVSLVKKKSDIKKIKRCFCTLQFQNQKLTPHECEPNICIPGKCNANECLERLMKKNEGLRTRKINAASVKKLTSSGTDLKSHHRSMHAKPSRSKKLAIKRSVYPDRQGIKISSNLSFSLEVGYQQIQEAAKQVKRIKETQSTVTTVSKKVETKVKTVQTKSRITSPGKKGYSASTASRNVQTTSKKKQNSRGSSAGKGESTISLYNRETQAKLQTTKDKNTGTLKRCFCTLKLHKVGDIQKEQTVQNKGVKKKECKKPDLKTSAVTTHKYKPLTSQTTAVAVNKHKPTTSRTTAVAVNKHKPTTSRTSAVAVDMDKSKKSKTVTTSSEEKKSISKEKSKAAKNTGEKMKTRPVSANTKLLEYECDPGVCIPDTCDPFECDKRIQRRNKNKERETKQKIETKDKKKEEKQKVETKDKKRDEKLSKGTKDKKKNEKATKESKDKKKDEKATKESKDKKKEIKATKETKVKGKKVDTKDKKQEKENQIKKGIAKSETQIRQKPTTSKVHGKRNAQGPQKSMEIGSNICISIEFFTKRNRQAKSVQNKRVEPKSKQVVPVKSKLNPLKRCFCTKSLNKSVPVYHMTNFTNVMQNYNNKYCSNLESIQDYYIENSELKLSPCPSQEQSQTCVATSSGQSNLGEQTSSNDRLYNENCPYKNTYNRIDVIEKCYLAMEMNARKMLKPKRSCDNKDIKVILPPKRSVLEEYKRHSSRKHKSYDRKFNQYSSSKTYICDSEKISYHANEGSKNYSWDLQNKKLSDDTRPECTSIVIKNNSIISNLGTNDERARRNGEINQGSPKRNKEVLKMTISNINLSREFSASSAYTPRRYKRLTVNTSSENKCENLVKSWREYEFYQSGGDSVTASCMFCFNKKGSKEHCLYCRLSSTNDLYARKPIDRSTCDLRMYRKRLRRHFKIKSNGSDTGKHLKKCLFAFIAIKPEQCEKIAIITERRNYPKPLEWEPCVNKSCLNAINKHQIRSIHNKRLEGNCYNMCNQSPLRPSKGYLGNNVLNPNQAVIFYKNQKKVAGLRRTYSLSGLSKNKEPDIISALLGKAEFYNKIAQNLHDRDDHSKYTRTLTGVRSNPHLKLGMKLFICDIKRSRSTPTQNTNEVVTNEITKYYIDQIVVIAYKTHTFNRNSNNDDFANENLIKTNVKESMNLPQIFKNIVVKFCYCKKCHKCNSAFSNIKNIFHLIVRFFRKTSKKTLLSCDYEDC